MGIYIFLGPGKATVWEFPWSDRFERPLFMARSSSEDIEKEKSSYIRANCSAVVSLVYDNQDFNRVYYKFVTKHNSLAAHGSTTRLYFSVRQHQEHNDE